MTLTDGEKLILLMLSDIHEHFKIKGESEVNFIRSTIFSGNLWAMEWKYPGIFHNSEPSKEVVTETLDVLEMWELIERSFGQLSPADRVDVKTGADPFGNVRSEGFDGNHEIDHIGVARCLVDELDRYPAFIGRNLNSHTPGSLEGYRRMRLVYKRLKEAMQMNYRSLTSTELIEVLNARRWSS